MKWMNLAFVLFLGVAKVSGLELGDIVMVNMFYELIMSRKACTSIIAQDSSGHIWHGRNLDQPLTEQLRKYLTFVNFHKNNKVRHFLLKL